MTTSVRNRVKEKSFAKLLYVAIRFSHINLTEKPSCAQGVTGRFVLFCSMNQNPGQSCCPSIDLTMVLKRKSDKDFKKVKVYRRILSIFCIRLSQKTKHFEL